METTERRFSFGPGGQARLTVARGSDGVRVTVFVQGMDMVGHAVAELIPAEMAREIGRAFLETGGEVRKLGMSVSAEMVAAKAEQLGVTVEELITDPFKAQFGVTVDELFGERRIGAAPGEPDAVPPR